MAKLKTKHAWKLADNQTDTGLQGVRVQCDIHVPGTNPHYMTVHENLLQEYLQGGKS